MRSAVNGRAAPLRALGRLAHSPTLVERVLREGTGVLAPAQREVTILFSDIRGFTTLSKHLPPQAVLQLLDRYLGLMSQVVRDHEGMVNKFLGDGMLACWGVPTPQGLFAGQRLSEEKVKGRAEAVVVYSLEAEVPSRTGMEHGRSGAA